MIMEFIKFYFKKGVFLIIASIFLLSYWFSAGKLPRGATLYPRLIITYAFIPVLLWNLISSVFDFLKEVKKKGDDVNIVKKGLDTADIKKVVGMVITLVYVLLIPRLGFFVSTTLFLAAFLYLLEIRNLFKAISYVILIEGFIYFIFIKWLGTIVPSGLLF